MTTNKAISACVLVAFIFTSCTLLSKKELENSLVVRVSANEFILSLANNSKDEKLLEALNLADEMQGDSSENYITLFGKAFSELSPDANLSEIFSTVDLRSYINFNSSNEEVLAVLQNQLDEVINNMINILRIRIDRYGIRHQNVTRIGNSENILVELPAIENMDRVKRLIETRAKLEFWETYELSEIYSYFDQVNTGLLDDKKIEYAIEMKIDKIDEEFREFAEKNPLFVHLRPAVDANMQLMQGPLVGYVAIQDTSTINYIFNNKSVKEILPQDLRFYWAYKPLSEDEDMLQLLAIKVTTRDGNAPIDGRLITDVKMEYDQNDNITIHLSMNSEGAKIWQRLTRDNIGRSIAITLDNNVYSYTTVQPEIKDGQTSIAGDFTENEAQDLVNILRTGPLPITVSIVDENQKKQ